MSPINQEYMLIYSLSCSCR